MKRFRLKADCIFWAENIDDALLLLSNHFKDPMSSGLFEKGYCDVKPYEVNEETDGPNEIKLPESIANIILDMKEICAHEGMGPSDEETAPLLKWIGEHYPHLKEILSSFKWPE